MSRTLGKDLLPWLVPVALLLLWHAATQSGWISQRILPAPLDVLRAGIDLTRNGQLVEHLGVSRSFASRRVLEGIDLELAAGEFVAVVGRSGGGKTTLLRLIAGLDHPNEGEIRIHGQALTGLHPSVRILFQDARLLPWLSVGGNVALGLRPEHRSRVAPMIEYVGLSGRDNDWPRILSGGQRQRVALARALVAEPSILLLDEPLCSLDALTRLEMLALIESLWRMQRFTSLLITHDVDEAITLADRVLVLEEGKFVMEVPVSLPRPRLRDSLEFRQLAPRVLRRLLEKPVSTS